MLSASTFTLIMHFGSHMHGWTLILAQSQPSSGSGFSSDSPDLFPAPPGAASVWELGHPSCSTASERSSVCFVFVGLLRLPKEKIIQSAPWLRSPSCLRLLCLLFCRNCRLRYRRFIRRYASRHAKKKEEIKEENENEMRERHISWAEFWLLITGVCWANRTTSNGRFEFLFIYKQCEDQNTQLYYFTKTFTCKETLLFLTRWPEQDGSVYHSAAAAAADCVTTAHWWMWKWWNVLMCC